MTLDNLKVWLVDVVRLAIKEDREAQQRTADFEGPCVHIWGESSPYAGTRCAKCGTQKSLGM